MYTFDLRTKHPKIHVYTYSMHSDVDMSLTCLRSLQDKKVRQTSRDQHTRAFPSILASLEHLEKRHKWIPAWISTYTQPFLPTKGCNSHVEVVTPTVRGAVPPSSNEVRVRADIIYRKTIPHPYKKDSATLSKQYAHCFENP